MVLSTKFFGICRGLLVNHLVQDLAYPKCIAMETKMMFPLMQVRVYRDDSLFAMHVLWPS